MSPLAAPRSQLGAGAPTGSYGFSTAPEPLDAAADRLLGRLSSSFFSCGPLAVATLLPLLHPPQLVLEAGLLTFVGAVGLRLPLQRLRGVACSY